MSQSVIIWLSILKNLSTAFLISIVKILLQEFIGSAGIYELRKKVSITKNNKEKLQRQKLGKELMNYPNESSAAFQHLFKICSI